MSRPTDKQVDLFDMQLVSLKMALNAHSTAVMATLGKLVCNFANQLFEKLIRFITQKCTYKMVQLLVHRQSNMVGEIGPRLATQ